MRRKRRAQSLRLLPCFAVQIAVSGLLAAQVNGQAAGAGSPPAPPSAQETALQRAAALSDSARAAVARVLVPDIQAPPPAAPPASWRRLIGEYGSARMSVTVLEHAGSLHALFNGSDLQPLSRADDNRFTLRDGSAITFAAGGALAANAVVDGITLPRRALGPEDGSTFRITPQRPVAELYREAIAAKRPVEPGEFVDAQLVELRAVDSTIRYDIRYATRNNFMGEVFYSRPLAFLQQPAARALARVSQRLRAQGLGLLVHDAYRPWYVTKMFWDATPDSLRDFVANPANGSRHNRGAAVDLSLYDLRTGEPVTMVSGYDEFSPRALPLYAGGTSRERWYRAVLRDAMESEGFTVYPFEWWHFDYRSWRDYRIGNQRFEDITGR